MPGYIGRRSQLDTELLTDLTLKMALCGHGKPVDVVAQAALDLALSVWLSAGVTRDAVMSVVTDQIDSLFHDRTN